MEGSRKQKNAATAVCLAAVAVLTAAALYQGSLANTYRRQLEYSYQEALGQLAESTAALAVDLEKACCTGNDPALWTISARLWRECGTAKAALSALPLEGEGLKGTAEFLSRAGDYAMALARGENPDDRSGLAKLVPYAQTLAQQTDSFEAAVLSGEIPLDALAFGYLKNKPNGEIPDSALAVSAPQEESPTEKEPTGGAGESAFAAMEEGFSGLPRLVYDGPFSTHLQEQSSKMLANLTHLSRDAARSAAAKALECDPAALEEAGDENGTIPAYLFTLGQQTAAITKQGGYLLWLTDGRTFGSPAVTLSDAKQTARQKLEELGFADMQSSYHEVYNNLAVFHFATFRGGVVCYPDLVKIGIALDSGKMVQLDARGFLMNHHDRSPAEPALTAQQAQELLSPDLRVESRRLALIPSPGGEERLCHEFLCHSSLGRQVLVYLNAQSGRQEDLLLLEIGPNGTLTV